MTRDGMSLVGRTDSIDARRQVTRELYVNKHPPIYVIGVGQDGGISRCFHLVPIRKGAIPGRIKSIEGLIFCP